MRSLTRAAGMGRGPPTPDTALDPIERREEGAEAVEPAPGREEQIRQGGDLAARIGDETCHDKGRPGGRILPRTGGSFLAYSSSFSKINSMYLAAPKLPKEGAKT